LKHPEPLVPTLKRVIGGPTFCLEKAMTTSLNNGSNAQRKTLATQLDRLDVILDGLSDALSGSVEMAVRDVVGQVVRETVEATIREVLANQDLLRASLDQKTTPEPQPMPAPMPKRRTLKDLIKSAGDWMCQKTKQAAVGTKNKIVSAYAWGIDKLGKGAKAAIGACMTMPSTLVSVGRAVWTFRKTTSIALAVGLIAGFGSYFAGPLVASIASGVSGAALTVSAMILVPLWRLMTGNGSI
jgi:hypothetical protein